MKKIRILFCVWLVSVCLPWFTFDMEMTGGYYGIYMLPYFALQIVILAWWCLQSEKSKRILNIAVVLALITIPLSYFLCLGMWHAEANITRGFDIKLGLQTSTWCFWCSFCIAIVMIVLIIKRLLPIKGNRGARAV